MTPEIVRSHLGRKVFVISNIGQHKILEGAAGSPLAGKLAAECVLLKLSGISVLRPFGREVQYTGKPLSRSIGLLVGDGALDVADRVAPPHDRPFRFELCLPDRAKEIDFQFHGSKGFIWGESTCKCYAHCGVSNIAKNSAMQRSHGICMLWSGRQDDRRAPISDVFRLKSDQPRDGNIVRLCAFPEVRLRGNFLSTHGLSAPAFDFRARTLVSRYSSR